MDSKTDSSDFAWLTKPVHNTSNYQIDDLLKLLQAHKNEWLHLGIKERVKLIDQIICNIKNLSDRWVNAELLAKGNRTGTMAEAEEWIGLGGIFRALRLTQRSLLEIQEFGRPRIPGPIDKLPNGQIVAQVFPITLKDQILFQSVVGQVWMESGVRLEEMINDQAWAYRDEDKEGKVALVLGAGNFSMLPIIDILHKLFVEKQVVALKLNPVNAHLGPLIEEGFEVLIDRGFMCVVYGGVAEGSYLCNHKLIDELHLTGSDKTYEGIVFGKGNEGKKNKIARKPINTKRFTAELGNVNPVIIIPAPWKKKDVIHQARQIASWLVSNAGFGCLTPRVIIQHESWPYRQQLIDEIGKILNRVETRRAYYPGARERHQKFLAAHPEAKQYGEASDDHLPWTIIPDVDPQNTSDICFREEAFCSLLAETAIDAPNVDKFIEESVRFSNQTLWGTLCATLIVHSKSLKDPSVKEAIRIAISKLRYGTVAVNMFTFYSAYLMFCPWGAFPGHDIFDIQSGIGKVTNFLMFKKPEKSVILAPFKRIDPLTVVSKRPHVFGRKMAEYEENPTWWKLPSLLWTTFRCYV